MFQIQNLLDIGSIHTENFSVFYYFFNLWKRDRNTFQNSLIIDVHLHIGMCECNVVYDINRKFVFRISGFSKLFFNASEWFSDFTNFSCISKKQIIQFFSIRTHVSWCLLASNTFSYIEVFFRTTFFDFRCSIVWHQIKPSVKIGATSEQFLYFTILYGHDFSSL